MARETATPHFAKRFAAQFILWAPLLICFWWGVSEVQSVAVFLLYPASWLYGLESFLIWALDSIVAGAFFATGFALVTSLVTQLQLRPAQKKYAILRAFGALTVGALLGVCIIWMAIYHPWHAHFPK